jgi:hypothetical protein
MLSEEEQPGPASNMAVKTANTTSVAKPPAKKPVEDDQEKHREEDH